MEQLEGIHNNIKGIYHEKLFQYNENNDGDEYIVELFEETNHAGADIKLINELTGEVKEFQLKATDSLSYINKHNDKYEYIDVIATDEVSSRLDDVTSSGITNESLNNEVDELIGTLDVSNNITSSMSIAAVVSLAKNIKILIKGQDIKKEEK